MPPRPMSPRFHLAARSPPPARAPTRAPKHDPEKACPGLDPGCNPVFGRDHAQRGSLTMEWFLPLIWAGIIGTAVALYVILDGFDLGIGMLFPFAKDDKERDQM